MLQPSILPVRLPCGGGRKRCLPRGAVALGVLAGLTAGATLHAAAGQLQGLILDHAWRTATLQSGAPVAFGGEPAVHAAPEITRVLHGVSGEVLASPSIQSAGAGPLADVSPAAWDRLSAGDCITVTTMGGQTLSFRILGAQPATEPKTAGTLPKIDLAVTACSGTGDPIARAVIEPARQPEAQRSL